MRPEPEVWCDMENLQCLSPILNVVLSVLIAHFCTDPLALNNYSVQRVRPLSAPVTQPPTGLHFAAFTSNFNETISRPENVSRSCFWIQFFSLPRNEIISCLAYLRRGGSGVFSINPAPIITRSMTLRNVLLWTPGEFSWGKSQEKRTILIDHICLFSPDRRKQKMVILSWILSVEPGEKDWGPGENKFRPV